MVFFLFSTAMRRNSTVYRFCSLPIDDGKPLWEFSMPATRVMTNKWYTVKWTMFIGQLIETKQIKLEFSQQRISLISYYFVCILSLFNRGPRLWPCLFVVIAVVVWLRLLMTLLPSHGFCCSQFTVVPLFAPFSFVQNNWETVVVFSLPGVRVFLLLLLCVVIKNGYGCYLNASVSWFHFLCETQWNEITKIRWMFIRIRHYVALVWISYKNFGNHSDSIISLYVVFLGVSVYERARLQPSNTHHIHSNSHCIHRRCDPHTFIRLNKTSLFGGRGLLHKTVQHIHT